MEPNKKAREIIEKRVGAIVTSFNFENRKKTNPDECPCYIDDKPCHDVPKEKLNCFLCYCPEYDIDSEVGGCKLGNPQGKGKWFYHPNLPKGRIWDCSDCTYPHNVEVAKKYFMEIFGLK